MGEQARIKELEAEVDRLKQYEECYHCDGDVVCLTIPELPHMPHPHCRWGVPEMKYRWDALRAEKDAVVSERDALLAAAKALIARHDEVVALEAAIESVESKETDNG